MLRTRLDPPAKFPRSAPLVPLAAMGPVQSTSGNVLRGRSKGALPVPSHPARNWNHKVCILILQTSELLFKRNLESSFLVTTFFLIVDKHHGEKDFEKIKYIL